MELGQNGTLLQYLNSNGPLSMQFSKKIFSQLISAVNYLHSNLQVLHRDIKLENIVLDKYLNIKLIDFGMSTKMTQQTSLFKTRCGSCHYAAPELFLDQGYDYKIDIWSLGVCFYTILSGLLPFQHSNINKLIDSILNSEIKYPENFSEDFKDLLKGMLTKNPKNRFTLQQIIDHPFFNNSILHSYINTDLKIKENNINDQKIFDLLEDYKDIFSKEELNGIFSMLKRQKLMNFINIDLENIIKNKNISQNLNIYSTFNEESKPNSMRSTLRTPLSMIIKPNISQRKRRITCEK